MTVREAAIVTAYTGYVIGDFNEAHKYIEEVMGRPVFIHEMGSSSFSNELKDRCREDFINIRTR